MKKNICIAALATTLILAANQTAIAQVSVVRSGDENPVLTIGKSTLYGAATGTLVGLALSLVVEEDFVDIMKWSFVGGTLGGFFIGVYHVASRPQPSSSALLQFDSSGLARVSLPQPQVELTPAELTGKPQRQLSVNMVSLNF